MLADTTAKLKPAPGYATVPFHFEDGSGAARPRLPVRAGVVTSSLRQAAYAHTDYNFETPSLSLLTQSEAEPVAKLFKGEQLPPAGGAPGARRSGDAVAAIRREELQAPHVRVLAGGTARGLFSGCLFTLENYPRESQNAEHLVLRADYRVVDPEYRPAIAGAGESYRVELLVAPTALPYRPPRTTPRPVMRGPQTATVVGPGGEEIFTDKYSRVKVQFHWDRLGKKDENSSLLRAGVGGLGGRRLGLHPDPAHRPGGDRRLHRGRPGPADHHRPGLQRRRRCRPTGCRGARRSRGGSRTPRRGAAATTS